MKPLLIVVALFLLLSCGESPTEPGTLAGRPGDPSAFAYTPTPTSTRTITPTATYPAWIPTWNNTPVATYVSWPTGMPTPPIQDGP